MDGKHLCRYLRIDDADDRLVLLTLDAQCFHCHFCKAKSGDIQSSSVASENRNDVGHELERIYWNISRALMAFCCAWKACCERWKVICKILLDFQWIYGFCGLPTELEFISYFISLSSRFPINFSCFHPETRTMGFAIDWEFITRIFQIASSLQAASLNLHFPAPHCVRARGIKKIDNFPQHLLSPLVDLNGNYFSLTIQHRRKFIMADSSWLAFGSKKHENIFVSFLAFSISIEKFFWVDRRWEKWNKAKRVKIKI